MAHCTIYFQSFLFGMQYFKIIGLNHPNEQCLDLRIRDKENIRAYNTNIRMKL